MSGPNDEAAQIATAAATRDDGTFDDDTYVQVWNEEYSRRLGERQDKLRLEAKATYRSMEGWQRVESDEHWLELIAAADQNLDSGAFLTERLGGERFLDPELMAALLMLRRRLVDEHAPASTADLMLIDTAVLSYYHLLRVTGWVGDLAAMLEHEFFGMVGLQAAFKESNGHQLGRVKGLRITEHVERIGERLMPLIDRSHKMMVQSLNTLQTRRQRPAPNVNIGQAGQVNVGQQQVNTTGAHDEV
jgi:hypothetical protein